jgi:hypothetical protein
MTVTDGDIRGNCTAFYGRPSPLIKCKETMQYIYSSNGANTATPGPLGSPAAGRGGLGGGTVAGGTCTAPRDLSPWFAATLRRMPPALILHGEADRLVPVAEALKIEQVLQERHLTYEIKLYPGQGHGFSASALADAARRSIAFLHEHLPAAGAGAPAQPGGLPPGPPPAPPRPPRLPPPPARDPGGRGPVAVSPSPPI